MRILIVEDDLSIAELERDYLAINGFECDIATDGVEGLKLALNNEYDLVILDIMLPGLDGFAVLSRIREEKDIPVLLISAKREEIDKIRGFGLGADDYITKPFSPSELVARVKMRIERYDRLTGRKEKSSVLKIGELEIDRDAHKVFVSGVEKQLTAKEYDLLLFLAENPNRVFSREVLFDRIWGLEALGEVATVTVHIQRVREKIEKDTQNPQYIETVWGAGYRFRM
ncbi:MAG: response regulator transcription factor [Clostridiales bacterium]|jgi:DNA-binding response OmpR family regulator|nr:response regulator transcription factor [Clostridiales bacterium]